MGCPPCKTFTPRLIGLSRGVTKRKKISKIIFVSFVCFGFVLFLSQRGLSPAVIRGSNWCEVNFEKNSVLFCCCLVLFCLVSYNVCLFCVFVLSLFRFHASPETTGEGKRGIGPARAGVTLEGTGETVPRGDGEPTRGGEGHEVRGNVGCSDKVPRGEGVCPTKGRSVGL